jgi:tripartite-type tricarboxylate transporter receptor subunit TctC
MRIRLCKTVLLLLFASSVWAQSYPSRTVRVVVPFPPGGAPDLVGRTLSARLAERLGQPFVVENRTGAGGNIAAEAVAKAAPDGYTLLASSDGPLVINPSVYKELPFNTLRDFAPISIAASAGLVLMACPALPVSSLQDVLNLSKSRKLTYASSGYGSSQHVAAELLKDSAGIDLTHVPYKGFGAAVGDAMSCNVDLIFGAISTGIPHIRGGKLKPIAVASDKRTPLLPELPTFREGGLDYITGSWFGVLAPAKTPQAVIDLLHANTVEALKDATLRAKMVEQGADLIGNTPLEFRDYIAAETARMAKVIKNAKIQLD